MSGYPRNLYPDLKPKGKIMNKIAIILNSILFSCIGFTVSGQQNLLQVVSSDSSVHVRWENVSQGRGKNVPQRSSVQPQATIMINSSFSKEALHALGKPDRAFTDNGTFILEFQRIGLTLYMDKKRTLQKAVIESGDAVIGETGERIGNVLSLVQYSARQCICNIKKDGFMELTFPESKVTFMVETRTRKIRAIEIAAEVERKKGNCECPKVQKN